MQTIPAVQVPLWKHGITAECLWQLWRPAAAVAICHVGLLTGLPGWTAPQEAVLSIPTIWIPSWRPAVAAKLLREASAPAAGIASSVTAPLMRESGVPTLARLMAPILQLRKTTNARIEASDPAGAGKGLFAAECEIVGQIPALGMPVGPEGSVAAHILSED